MIKFKKIAAVAMSVCMTLGILGDANLGLDQQVDADDKVISQIEIEIPNFNLAAGEVTGITGGASPFSSSTEGVDYASFGIVSCKNSKGEEQVYNGESDALVEGFEYTVQAYVDLKKGYSVAKNINFILKCKDVNIAIDMTQVPDAAPYTYQIGYKVKSLDVLIQESVYAGATLINSGAKLNIPSNTSTYDYYKFVLPTAANIEFDAGNLSDKFEIVVYDSSYNAVSTVSKSDGTFEKYKWKSEEMKAGTYYLSVKAMSSGSTKQITFNTYPIVTNNEESKPEAVNLPADGKSSKITWLQVENGGKKYDYYYKLVVNEKAYYHFDIGSGSTVVLYKTSYGKSRQKTYQTYTKTNPQTGEVYSGRTSGYGTPAENIQKRDANHHMNGKGFGTAVLDKSSSNYNAIRGREQMLITKHGGAKKTGGTSGNAINGIGKNNKKKSIYINSAIEEFGGVE